MELNTKLSKIILFTLHIFGLWPNGKSPTSLKLYKFYSYAIHFTFSLMFLMCMVLNYETIGSIHKETEALFPTITVLSYCLKVVNFYLNASGMQRTFVDVMQFEFKNDNEIRMTNDKLRYLYRFSMCFILTAHFTMVSTFMRVLFISGPAELPLPSWYPIDWKNNQKLYWIVYSYQTLGAFLILNVNLTLDLYLIFLMAIICKHLETVGDRLANLTANHRNITPHTRCLDVVEQSRMNDELIDCIKVHQNLIRTIDAVERNFTFGSFCLISLSGVITCCAAYTLTILSPIADSVRFVYCLAFFITSILEIFMISYFGEQILTASSLLTFQAYSTS
ncbi:putative odorant receptor 71a, partial [Pseudolycoriella hygida]